jgi:hypothetical protein
VVSGREILRYGAAPAHPLVQLYFRSGDNILVGRRSWFHRNGTFFIGALLSVTSIVITLSR